MNQYELSSQIQNEFDNIVKAHLPPEWIIERGNSGPIFLKDLSTLNAAYKDSQYFYKGDGKFIHWTSFQNLMSIINSRKIRLYNLHSSDDRREFKFAARKLDVPKPAIDHYKNYLFTFSFCELEKLNSAYHWETYGKNRTGVAIEFEFANSPLDWDKYMLSEVYYEMPHKFVSLINELKILRKKYEFTDFDWKLNLGRFIGFHKNPNFKLEKEIRLSSIYPFKLTSEYNQFCNTEFRFSNGIPRSTKYLELELYIKPDSAFSKDESNQIYNTYELNPSRPQIKITNIHFGENSEIAKSKCFGKLRDELMNVIKYKLLYPINLPFGAHKNYLKL